MTVNGRGVTTAVTVNQRTAATASQTQAGVVTGSVTVNDLGSANAADTIGSVSLNNFGGVTVTSSSLNTLNLAGGSIDGVPAVNGNITLTRSAATGTVANLIINSSGGQFGAISGTQADQFTSASVNASGFSVFNDFTAPALTSLTINGAGSVAFSANTLGGATTTNIDARTNTGGVILGGPLNDATRFRGGSGNDSIRITANNTAIDMGGGSNTVEINSATIGSTGSVNAGPGVTDRLSLSASNAAVATASAGAQANFADKISGFDALLLSGVTNQTIDLARLDNISDVTQQGANGLTLNNFQSGGTLRYAGTSTAATVNVAGSSSSDVLNVQLGATTAFAAGTLSAPSIETVNISAIATTGTFTQTIASGNTVTSINLAGAGANPFTLTNTDTSVTSLNASGLTGAFTWTSGALAGASTVVGSATAANTVNLSAAAASVNYTGGTGINNVTTGSFNDTVNGGSNADNLSGGNGQDVINSGGNTNPNAVDTITGGAGADTISIVGSPNALIVNDNNSSGSNTATSVATSVIATGFDRITGATNGVRLNLFLQAGQLGVNTNVQNLAGSDNAVNFATGTFANGTFTFNPNGFDTLATYDTNAGSGVAYESVVLSGFIAGSQTANTGGNQNIITLSTLNV